MATRHIQTLHLHDDYKVQREFERAGRENSTITLRGGNVPNSNQPGSGGSAGGGGSTQGPKGEKGDPGERGPQGPPGLDGDPNHSRWALSVQRQTPNGEVIWHYPKKRIQNLRFADNYWDVFGPGFTTFDIPNNWEIFSESFNINPDLPQEISKSDEPYDETIIGEQPKWMEELTPSKIPGQARIKLIQKMRAWTVKNFTIGKWYLPTITTEQSSERDEYPYRFANGNYDFTTGRYGFYTYNDDFIINRSINFFDLSFIVQNMNGYYDDFFSLQNVSIKLESMETRIVVTGYIKIPEILMNWKNLINLDINDYIRTEPDGRKSLITDYVYTTLFLSRAYKFDVI